MMHRKTIVVMCALALAAAAGAGIGFQRSAGADEDGDIGVTLDQCPAAVQATIRAQVGGGTINEIERSPAGRFEVDANGADGQFEFVVAGDGTYLGPEVDDGDDDGPDDDHD